MDEIIKEIENDLKEIKSDFEIHNNISKYQIDYILTSCKRLIDMIRWEQTYSNKKYEETMQLKDEIANLINLNTERRNN
jgi:hypothetical protein